MAVTLPMTTTSAEIARSVAGFMAIIRADAGAAIARPRDARTIIDLNRFIRGPLWRRDSGGRIRRIVTGLLGERHGGWDDGYTPLHAEKWKFAFGLLIAV